MIMAAAPMSAGVLSQLASLTLAASAASTVTGTDTRPANAPATAPQRQAVSTTGTNAVTPVWVPSRV